MRERLAAGLAAAILVVLSTVWWAGLYADVPAGHLVALVAWASLPGVASLAPRAPRIAVGAALVVATVAVAAICIGRPAAELIGLSGDAWGDVARLIPDGLAAANTASTPASPIEDPQFVALLDLALAALAGSVAWLTIARHRVGAAVVVVGIGLAYRWTVEAPGSPVVAGCVALAGMLAALALVGRGDRPVRTDGAVRAGVAVAACVAVAAVVGSGQAQADQAWWQWRDWSVGGSRTVGSLDIRQQYGRLDWPETPRVVMRVRTPAPVPLRAAALAEFDGLAFTVSRRFGSSPLLVEGDRVDVDTTVSDDPEPVTQLVRLQATTTTLVPASGRILSLRGDIAGADRIDGGAVLVSPPLGPDEDYLAEVVIPDPDPARLLAARTYTPGEAPPGSTDVRPVLNGRAVTVPVWGTSVAQPTDGELGDYARVRALARSVAGDARSPYVAVNRIEAHLRSRYRYDEAPPQPPSGSSPLVEFLFTGRRGFCQHFAGSMAVMLRTIGIPSRVAVGYTPGRFDPDTGEWVVLDRDAHAWVEVLLPGEGWVAFDPTPGRYAPNRVSVGSPDYAPPDATVPDAEEIVREPVGVPEGALPNTPQGPVTEPNAPPDTAPGGGTGDGGGPLDGLGLWPAALLVGVAALVGAPLWRAARRRRDARRGTERARVLSALGALEADLRALGAPPEPGADAEERARDLRTRLGVDAAGLYRRAEDARYGRRDPEDGQGRAAWEESRRLRREVRRRVPRRRRVAAALGLRRGGRATVAR